MGEALLEPGAIASLTFGQLLRSLRRRRGLSLQRLSEATEIDVAYLSRLENGKKDNPTGPLLACIADALELEGADRFLFFCKALEAKYGPRYVFGPERQDFARRIYDAVLTVFRSGWRLLGQLPGWGGRAWKRP